MAGLAVLLLPAGLVVLLAQVASGWTRLIALGTTLLVLGFWPGLTGDLLRLLASMHVLLPLLPLLLFHLRFWRGAAPQVFLLTLLGFNGWVLAMALARSVGGISPGPLLWLVRLLGLGAGVGLALVLLQILARRHSLGELSDQTLALDCWWLLYSLMQVFVVSVGLGLGGGALALLSFVLGRWITGWAWGRLAAPEAPPLRLLLLRVFGNSRRSERLFEQLVQAWTPLGSIELIGGADLALQQVSPVDFLAFLTGRLGERFGASPAETALSLIHI